MNVTGKKKRRQGSFAVPVYGSPPPRPERVPVVIEASADGWISVFAPPHVDARFINRLDCRAADVADLLDQYVELSLPLRHRVIYASHPRLVDQVQRIRPSDECDRLRDLELVKACRELAQSPQAAEVAS